MASIMVAIAEVARERQGGKFQISSSGFRLELSRSYDFRD